MTAAVPEMPEQHLLQFPQRFITLGDLRALLATQGLHIYTEAERKVLDACAAFPTEHLTGDAYPSLANKQELSDLSLRWSRAELARRGER